MSTWKEIEDKILWDFKLGEEFKRPMDGYAFLIDVFEGKPKLVLYRIKRYRSETSSTKKQPPAEMMLSAVLSQNGDPARGGLFLIDEAVKWWIMENMINEE